MIVPMKKITLIGLKSDEEQILKSLQRIGAVEIITPDEADPYTANSDLFSQIQQELKSLSETMGLLKPYSQKQGLLTPDIELSEGDINRSKHRSYELCNRVIQLSKQLAYKKSGLDRLNKQYKDLEKWLTLEFDFTKLQPTKNTVARCGYVPKSNIPQILELDLGVQQLRCASGKSEAFVVICHREQIAEADRALQELEFVDFNIPKGMATIKDYGASIKEQCAECEQEIGDLTGQLKEAGQDMPTLLAAEDAINTEYARLQAMADILISKSAFMLYGWVRDDKSADVEEAVKVITDAYYLELTEPSDTDDVPVVTKNNQLVSAFEGMVNLYARPTYKGIDATPLTAPFYILFYGIMMADVGYGLLFFIACLLYEKIKKPRENDGIGSLAKMFKWCGLSTAVCGLLFGGVFGVDMDNIFGTTNIFPLILSPLDNIMLALYLSCGLGIAQMFFGLGIKAYMCIRDGDVSAALYDYISWIMTIGGILGGALLPKPYNAPFIIFAGIGILLILVFGGRNKKGIMKIFGGIGSLYNITGWISDIASYTRIVVLSIVGGAMAEVFNMIGGMLASSGQGLVGVVTTLLGAVVILAFHAFGLFINTLGAYAHTARLQYVEFFGKFYDSGGRAFNPLKVNDKNIKIKG